MKEEIDTAAAAWEGDIIQDSKFADDLVQVWKYYLTGACF
jgi:hypothetical protein